MEEKVEDRTDRVIQFRLEGFIRNNCLTRSPLKACGDDEGLHLLDAGMRQYVERRERYNYVGIYR